VREGEWGREREEKDSKILKEITIIKNIMLS